MHECFPLLQSMKKILNKKQIILDVGVGTHFYDNEGERGLHFNGLSLLYPLL